MIEAQVPPGYKRTEVGVIPEDWEISSIGNIVEIITGKSKSRFISDGGRYLIVDMGAVSRNGQLIASKRTDHDSDLLELGDLAMPKDDIGGGNIIGKVAFIDEMGKYVLGDHVYLLRTAEQISKFLCYAINSDRINKSLRSKASGSAQLGLARRDVEAQEIPLPPLPEQRAIAEALSDTDAWIAALDKLIVKKRALKQAAMSELLTGRARLPGFQKKPGIKRAEVGIIPEDWEVRRLGDLTSFYKGSGLSKTDLAQNGSFPCIHYGELFTRYGATITEVISRTDRRGDLFLSMANDVLMPASDVTPNGLATASCIKRSGVVLGGDVLVIRGDPEILDGVFLAYLISNERDQILRLVSGTTVVHIYARDMASFHFPVPDISEQRAIAQVLSDMDAEIEALERQRAKAQGIKQGMMQELLTGRIRLVEKPEVETHG